MVGNGYYARTGTGATAMITTSSSSSYVTGSCMPYRETHSAPSPKPKEEKRKKNNPVPPWLRHDLRRDGQ